MLKTEAMFADSKILSTFDPDSQSYRDGGQESPILLSVFGK
jgi:hypothetical protein